MKVLDIDLDYFLNDIALHRTDSGNRLSSEYVPWGESEVRSFLELKCGLSLHRKLKGKIIRHHDESFNIWRDMHLNDEINNGLEVTHIDAHADLGLGDSGWVEIMTDLLHKDVDDRVYPKKISCGNYLAYAIACRWIKKLTYVTHPEWSDYCDIPWLLMKGFEDSSGAIQLKKYEKGTVPDVMNIKKIQPLSLEPEVPFNIVSNTDYKTSEQYEYLIIAQSPGYTPKSSDSLLELFKEYML